MKKLSRKRKLYLDNKSRLIHDNAELNQLRKSIWLRSRRKKLLRLRKVNGKRSDILELQSSVSTSWHLPDANYTYSAPAVFSIIKDPKNTIKSINSLARMAWIRLQTLLGSFYIDLSKIDSFDLAANVLLRNLIVSMREEVKDGPMPDLVFQGNLPKQAEYQKYIRAMGLLKELDIASQRLPDRELSELIIFSERATEAENRESPYDKTRREKVSEKFISHVNQCLFNSGLELTESGSENLLLSLGEIIDNAELHSGMINWALYGYLDTSLDVPAFEVVMLNYGLTIAETFKQLDRNSYAWDQMSGYIEKHQGSFSLGWREEDLLTVVALQPNISSKNSVDDSTRGHGTVQLLEFFNIVSKYCNGTSDSETSSCAEMAILSGSTHIYFDGTYRLESKDGRQVIAFNKENDLSKKPDKDYVTSLGREHFPGTIVAIKFPLPAGLTEKTNG